MKNGGICYKLKQCHGLVQDCCSSFLPKQLDFANTLGVKNVVIKFRIILVWLPWLSSIT